MKLFARSRALLLGSVLLAACGGGSDGPSAVKKGSLEVAVTGLPAGTSAAVTVTGPGGFSRSVGASSTLSELTPGTYTVAAAQVGAGADGFAVEQASQTATVSAGATASVQVAYQTVKSSLSLALTGVPASAQASVTVTGPGGFSRTVTGAGALFGLAPGSYTVIAGGAATADSTYQGRPYRQTVTVDGSGAASVSLAYASVGPAALDLSVDGMYLTQAIQRPDNSVPLVKDRNGYLRVFLKASVANTAQVSVRARYFINGQLVRTDTVPAPTAIGVPTAATEATAGAWSVQVPGSVFQPGLSVTVDVDPENALRESNEGNQAFPAGGTPMAPQVVAMPTLAMSFVPVHHVGTALTGRVNAANLGSYTSTIRKIYPFASYDVSLHETYNTQVAPLGADGTGWDLVLDEMLALRTAEASSRFYMGVITPTYNGGVAGLGYIGAPAAVSWDFFDVPNTVAHELGHNFGRRHSPCNFPAGVDQDYPYPSGNIGVYGMDVDDGVVKAPTTSDIMGYCNVQWVSDYTYQGVVSFILNGTTRGSGPSNAVRPSLLVWGRITGQGEMVLEPAFPVTTRPSLPAESGPYTVEGLDASGARVFSLAFAASEVADMPGGGRQFAFAVPLDDARIARIATLRLAGAGRAAVVRTSAAAPALDRVTGPQPTPFLRRDGEGRVNLRWDAAQAPMVMVRDARSGQVVSFAREGAASLETRASELDLVYSDGVHSAARRVRVQ
jgi:hypothetical protein